MAGTGGLWWVGVVGEGWWRVVVGVGGCWWVVAGGGCWWRRCGGGCSGVVVSGHGLPWVMVSNTLAITLRFCNLLSAFSKLMKNA